MMPTYPIVEIFHSVQGEAFHTGVPHVFIRFGNCNLAANGVTQTSSPSKI